MRYSVKGIDSCTSSFEYNRSELCINPYHYKKAIEIAPATAPATAPAAAPAAAHTGIFWKFWFGNSNVGIN